MLYLPAAMGVLGLFVGRHVAVSKSRCPHRGKVWGAVLTPLLLLLIMLKNAPLVFLVSMGAAIGAGVTAHAPMRVSLVATLLMVSLATFLGSQFVI